MRRLRPFVVTSGLVLALVVGVLVITRPDGRVLLPGARLISGPGSFTLSGTVAGLAPGVSSTLVLTAANPNNVPITLASVTVSVTTVPTACPVANLTLNSSVFSGTPPSVTFSGLTQVVPATGSTTVSFPILLARTAPNGCQVVTFPFSYSGTANYTAPTATTLVASPNPSTFGASVNFTATVADTASPAVATPVGSVTFYRCTNPATLTTGSPASACSASTALGAAQAVDGTGHASLSTTSLPVGSSPIFAVFTPTDATSFVASSSTVIVQVVTQASTSLLLSSSPNPSNFGQAVLLTAHISPASGPTGTVSFYLGTPSGSHSLLGTGTLSASGTATFTTSALPPGTDSLYAVYGGNGTFLGSTSPVITQTVGFSQACITKTINGGFVVLAGQSICFSGRVNGGIVIQPTAALYLKSALVNGGIVSTGAAGFLSCGSTLNGNLTISGSTGFVEIGDGGDDGPPGCAANQLDLSLLTLSGNKAGFEFAGNNVTGSVSFLGNTGTGPTGEDAAPEVEGNTIIGALTCAATNSPAIVDGGQRNNVTGLKTGQCAGAAF